MNCFEILIETGMPKRRAKQYAGALAAALKKRGIKLEEEEKLESKDVTEPLDTYKKDRKARKAKVDII